MVPLVDTHCHLLAGLDDGPRTDEEALEMCQRICAEGTRVVAATAHLGEHWTQVTPAVIRAATERLAGQLQSLRLPLVVYPCGEIMIRPGIEELWSAGQLLGVAGGSAYALMELPSGLFLEIQALVAHLVQLGVRPILAHPERHPEMLHHRPVVEGLIRAGCLMQVMAESILSPANQEDEQALRGWISDGVAHLVASDGHNSYRRPPRLAEAWRRVADWAGPDTANRLLSINGLLVMEGAAVHAPPPKSPTRRWFLPRSR